MEEILLVKEKRMKFKQNNYKLFKFRDHYRIIRFSL